MDTGLSSCFSPLFLCSGGGREFDQTEQAGRMPRLRRWKTEPAARQVSSQPVRQPARQEGIAISALDEYAVEPGGLISLIGSQHSCRVLHFVELPARSNSLSPALSLYFLSVVRSVSHQSVSTQQPVGWYSVRHSAQPSSVLSFNELRRWGAGDIPLAIFLPAHLLRGFKLAANVLTPSPSPSMSVAE